MGNYLFEVPEGYTDDQLLQEFRAAEAEVEAEGGPQPDSEGFERLWSKVIKEHERGGYC